VGAKGTICPDFAFTGENQQRKTYQSCVCASRRPHTPRCKPVGHTKLTAAGCGMPRRPCRDLPLAVA
jgi:hypothetical protein